MPNNNLKDLLLAEQNSLKKKLDAVTTVLATLDSLPKNVLAKPRKVRSAAARKAQSDRMRAYWAAKRKGKK